MVYSIYHWLPLGFFSRFFETLKYKFTLLSGWKPTFFFDGNNYQAFYYGITIARNTFF
jgi:hypothetical protein